MGGRGGKTIFGRERGAPKGLNLSWRKIKGQHDQGQQDREPLRGKSASERVSERTSERGVFRGFQSFSEAFRGFQRFSEALSEPLSEGHFPLRVAGPATFKRGCTVRTGWTFPIFFIFFGSGEWKAEIRGDRAGGGVGHFIENATKGGGLPGRVSAGNWWGGG